MKVKVFGERGTGTRFMRDVLRANGWTDLWPGTIAELGEWHRVEAAERADRPAGDRTLLREALIDDLFAASFDRTLGWKHGAPDHAGLRAVAPRATIFVVTVKNPYAWVVSMFRHPHHNLLTGNGGSIEDFVGSPWVTCGRDNVQRHLGSVVALWTLKYRAWSALAEAFPVVMIRYEDLLGAPDALAPLSSALTGNAKRGWTLPDRVDGIPGTLREYRESYAQERWRGALSPGVVAAITAHLDQELVARLGYAVIGG